MKCYIFPIEPIKYSQEWIILWIIHESGIHIYVIFYFLKLRQAFCKVCRLSTYWNSLDFTLEWYKRNIYSSCLSFQIRYDCKKYRQLTNGDSARSFRQKDYKLVRASPTINNFQISNGKLCACVVRFGCIVNIYSSASMYTDTE